MNWCLASSHSLDHWPVRELTIRNHLRYATKHNMDLFWSCKPWNRCDDLGIRTLLDLIDRYDAVMTLGADVIITAPDRAPDAFYDSRFGVVVSQEDIGGCAINNDAAIWSGWLGKAALMILESQKQRVFAHKWLWQGVMAELMNDAPLFATLVKALPQTEIQSLPPWEYPDKVCCWKPGHFSCHFLMENKVERMTRFLTEHPEYA